jgi:NADH-quinone oxidoreductase subunit J
MIEPIVEQLFFLGVGAVAAFCAAMVVLSRKAVYSALFLVVTIFCVAVLYLSLSAEFLAAVQLIVYAGAIVILFLFVIMMLNPRADEGPTGPRFFVPLAVLIALLLLAQIGAAITVVTATGLVTFPPPAVDWGDNTVAIGKLLFSEYALPFELTSVLLLVAILGATTLARRREAEGEGTGFRMSGGVEPVSAPRAADLGVGLGTTPTNGSGTVATNGGTGEHSRHAEAPR